MNYWTHLFRFLRSNRVSHVGSTTFRFFNGVFDRGLVISKFRAVALELLFDDCVIMHFLKVIFRRPPCPAPNKVQTKGKKWRPRCQKMIGEHLTVATAQLPYSAQDVRHPNSISGDKGILEVI